MNLEQTAAQPTGGHDTHVSGVQLLLARALWGLCLVLGVGLFVGALPTYFAYLHVIVASAVQGVQQLTPRDVRALHTLGFSLDSYAWFTLSTNIVLLLVYVLVGTALFWRASSDRVALLASFTLILFPVALNGQIVDLLPPVFTVPTACARFLGSASLGLFFYLFPSGRFVPRWTGILAIIWIGFWATQSFLPSGPFLLSLLALLVLLTLLASQLVLQIYRYRHVSTPTERQQTKWVVFGLVIAFGGILLELAVLFVLLPLFLPVDPLISTLGQTLSTLLLLFFPLSIGFAILRYRLWDIDFIINRTLVYGALTIGIIGIYVFVVGYFALEFRVYGSPIISILATGLVAVLFQPLRNWVQRLVNRAMYGERDDPYTVISRLGSRLETTLAPDTVLPAIVETVAQALKLPYAAITVKQDEGFSVVAFYGAEKGGLVRLPLIYQTEHIGELLLAPRAPGESFSSADRRLLDDLARQAGIAAHAVSLTTNLQRLTQELQHARQSLVTTREEERRRLRRDLHDGIGSVLASLNWRAGAIRRLLARDPVAADALVVEQQHTIQAAIGDIRRLVYDLRPPTLDELGLVGAIRERAAKQNLPTKLDSGHGLRIDVVVADDLSGLPAAAEVAAYRIVQEALANVTRHAHAQQCQVRLSHEEGLLQIEVTDNGIGLPDGYRAGVGLLSMRERAEELGGACEISRMPTGGTQVLACLPLLTYDEEL